MKKLVIGKKTLKETIIRRRDTLYLTGDLWFGEDTLLLKSFLKTWAAEFEEIEIRENSHISQLIAAEVLINYGGLGLTFKSEDLERNVRMSRVFQHEVSKPILTVSNQKPLMFEDHVW